MNRIRSIVLAATVVCTTAMAQKSITVDGNTSAAQTVGPASAAGVLENESYAIDISSLSPGLHRLTMRVKDSEGVWSIPATRYFVVPRVETPKATAIVAREYWIDGDVASHATLGSSPAAISIGSLSPGLHRLTMRVKDDVGVWSVSATRYFLVPHQAEPTVVLDRYMYWFDISAASSATVVKGELTGNTIDIDCSGLATGSHTLYWRMGDSRGVWSNRIYKTVFSYTLPASGLGTFSATTPLALHDDLEAGYATTYVDGSVWVKDISEGVVPSNTGVLLKGTGGTKYLLTGAETEEPELTGNALVAVLTETYVPATTGNGDEEYTNFMLSGGKFIKIAPWNSSDSSDLLSYHMMPANRAYLPILTSALQASSNAISLMWGDEATSISEEFRVNSEEFVTAKGWFSLDGRKLSGKPTQRGIYIVNGKKVVIK